MRNAAFLLFPGLIAVSLVAHLVVLQWGIPKMEPVQEAPPMTERTEIFLVEQQPEPPALRESKPTYSLPPEPEPVFEPVTDAVDVPEQIQPVTPEPPPPEPTVAPPKTKNDVRLSRPRSDRPIVQASTTTNVPVPVLIKNPPPVYPELARQKGWEGRAIVRVEVSTSGQPTKVSIARSSGFGVLDQAALRTVKTWRFQPRTIGGLAAPGLVEVPVHFSLVR